MDNHHHTTLARTLNAPLSRRAVIAQAAGDGLAVASAAAGLRVASVAARTATPAPGTGGNRFRLGNVDALIVGDGQVTLPASFAAVNAPPREVARVLAADGLTPDALRIPINNLVLETGRDLVLVDTGYGRLAGPTVGRLLPNLRAVGIEPDDVTLVVITHGHPDHIAGTVDSAGAPVFPKARYVIGRTEWDYWTTEPSLAELPLTDDLRVAWRAAVRDYLVPLRDRIELVDPGTEVANGVRLLAAAGHTPGMLAVEVGAGGERLLHVSDAAFHPVLSLAHPDWFALPDGWPAQAMQTRRALFERAASERFLVATSHLPAPGVGRVHQDGDGWAWEPAG